jgi:hypothetical protein
VVGSRHHATKLCPRRRVGQGGAQEHPFQAALPGVDLGNVAETAAAPVGRIEPPPHLGPFDEVRPGPNHVVVDVEGGPHKRMARDVEQVVDPAPRAGQGEE